MTRVWVVAPCAFAIATHVLMGVRETGSAASVLRAGSCQLWVEVADTTPRRATGLGHTAALRADGLLLRWPRPGLHAIWMRDMAYPLDLAWLDVEGVVRAALSNVPACPREPCPVYAPAGAAASAAVLEVAAGRLAACGLRVGSLVTPAPAAAEAGR